MLTRGRAEPRHSSGRARRRSGDARQRGAILEVQLRVVRILAGTLSVKNAVGFVPNRRVRVS